MTPPDPADPHALAIGGPQIGRASLRPPLPDGLLDALATRQTLDERHRVPLLAGIADALRRGQTPPTVADVAHYANAPVPATLAYLEGLIRTGWLQAAGPLRVTLTPAGWHAATTTGPRIHLTTTERARGGTRPTPTTATEAHHHQDRLARLTA